MKKKIFIWTQLIHTSMKLLVNISQMGPKNTGYPTLNASKIKHYMSSTIKCTGDIDTFSNTGRYGQI